MFSTHVGMYGSAEASRARRISTDRTVAPLASPVVPMPPRLVCDTYVLQLQVAVLSLAAEIVREARDPGLRTQISVIARHPCDVGGVAYCSARRFLDVFTRSLLGQMREISDFAGYASHLPMTGPFCRPEGEAGHPSVVRAGVPTMVPGWILAVATRLLHDYLPLAASVGAAGYSEPRWLFGNACGFVQDWWLTLRPWHASVQASLAPGRESEAIQRVSHSIVTATLRQIRDGMHATELLRAGCRLHAGLPPEFSVRRRPGAPASRARGAFP